MPGMAAFLAWYKDAAALCYPLGKASCNLVQRWRSHLVPFFMNPLHYVSYKWVYS